MTLGLAPRVVQVSQNWCSLTYIGKFRAIVWTVVTGWIGDN